MTYLYIYTYSIYSYKIHVKWHHIWIILYTILTFMCLEHLFWECCTDAWTSCHVTFTRPSTRIRYEPQRCYNFPQLDRRRNAKVDIYQHVSWPLISWYSWCCFFGCFFWRVPENKEGSVMSGLLDILNYTYRSWELYTSPLGHVVCFPLQIVVSELAWA